MVYNVALGSWRQEVSLPVPNASGRNVGLTVNNLVYVAAGNGNMFIYRPDMSDEQKWSTRTSPSGFKALIQVQRLVRK